MEKAQPHRKPWRPFTREPATHPLTPRPSPCHLPKAEVIWPYIPGPCPGAALKQSEPYASYQRVLPPQSPQIPEFKPLSQLSLQKGRVSTYFLLCALLVNLALCCGYLQTHRTKGCTIPGTLALNLFIFKSHLIFRSQCFCVPEPSNISQAAVVLDLGSCSQAKAEDDLSPQCSAYVRSDFSRVKARNSMKQPLSPHGSTVTVYSIESMENTRTRLKC